jgi:glycosyltransferase involved in cell wall biosynthesis
MQNFFSIIVDTCNHEKWIGKCLESCLMQDYNNYEIIIMDAKSDDDTFIICEGYKNKNKNIKLYQNEIRLPQVANFMLLSKLSRNNSIIVSVDGDDWFKHKNVLNKLNEVYNSGDVWMTYGSYEEYPYRDVSFHYREYPKNIIDMNYFREYDWLGSHLRTFRRDLILKINESDLKCTDGEWLTTTGDQAIMLPMLEMSRNKSRFISEVLYVYNVSDNTRDSSVNEKKQIELAKFIRSKEKYKKLESI